jgi:hypothetical protein
MRKNCPDWPVFAWLAVLLTAVPGIAGAQSALPKPDKDTVLKAADINAKLFPESVFFRGQSAPVEMRNTGGVHFSDDLYVLAGMVDNSGYSSGIRDKYQAYLLTEVPLRIGGQTLSPGAYGMGFLDGGRFVVLDLGAHDLIEVGSGRDSELRRPVPLQVLASAGGNYRLYLGRDFVEFSRMK